MKQLIRTRAELSEAYEGLQQEIFRLDTLHELVGDALARVKSLQWEEANKLERLIGADTSKERNTGGPGKGGGEAEVGPD